MKTSDQILACDVCREYAKRLDPQNHEDLFQEAWLKIREREIKDPTFKAKAYKYYFFRTLKNEINMKYRSHMPTKQIHENDGSEVFPGDGDIDSACEAYINEWLAAPPKDEDDLFYKDIITLAIAYSSVEAICEEAGISKRSFYVHLREAKNRLKYDYLNS